MVENSKKFVQFARNPVKLSASEAIGGVSIGSSNYFLMNFAYVPSTVVRRGDDIARFGT